MQSRKISSEKYFFFRVSEKYFDAKEVHMSAMQNE